MFFFMCFVCLFCNPNSYVSELSGNLVFFGMHEYIPCSNDSWLDVAKMRATVAAVVGSGLPQVACGRIRFSFCVTAEVVSEVTSYLVRESALHDGLAFTCSIAFVVALDGFMERNNNVTIKCLESLHDVFSILDFSSPESELIYCTAFANSWFIVLLCVEGRL